MKLTTYIDKQDNSKRKCFRLRLIDLDSGFNIDKSTSFNTKKESERTKLFVEPILSIAKRDVL